MTCHPTSVSSVPEAIARIARIEKIKERSPTDTLPRIPSGRVRRVIAGVHHISAQSRTNVTLASQSLPKPAHQLNNPSGHAAHQKAPAPNPTCGKPLKVVYKGLLSGLRHMG